MTGYIRMQRGWLDHPVFRREPFDRRSAWAWMICEAAFKPRTVTVCGKEVHLERGQLCHSNRFMAQAWGWDEKKVRRFLKKLESWSQTAAHSVPGSAALPKVITICNYEKYQATPKETASPTAAPSVLQPPQTRIKEISSTNVEGGAPPQEDLDKLLYQRGKAVLGKSAGGLITKLKKAHGVGTALELIEAASRKENPSEYIAGAIRNEGSQKRYGQITELHPDGERNAWWARIKGFRDKNFWLDSWGHNPKHPDCEAPRDILAEFGYGPKAAERA